MKENEADRKLVKKILKEDNCLNTFSKMMLEPRKDDTTKACWTKYLEQVASKVRAETEKKILDEIEKKINSNELSYFDIGKLRHIVKDDLIRFLDELRKRHGISL